MAFCSKLGSLIRQTGLRKTVSVPGMNLINTIRYMSTSSTRLFIGNLSYGMDDHSLKQAFDSYGNVIEARVIVDRDTGRSRGFGFVNYEDDGSASAALSSMDGKELQGRNIRVSYSNEKPSYAATGGGSFGSGSTGHNDF